MTVEILSTGSLLNSKTKLVCGATDYEFDRFKTWQTSGEFSTLTSASSDSILFLDKNEVEVYRADKLGDSRDLTFMVLDSEKVWCKQHDGTRKEVTYYKMLVIELGLVRWMSGLFFIDVSPLLY